MTTWLVAGGAVLGLLVGSFINVVAHRVPAGISVVTPPSSCPRCGRAIRHRHNLPVMGWLLLRGRCRDCGEPISVRYPIVEAATSLLFAVVPLVVDGWVIPAYWWFVGVTVTLILTDLDHRRIPNRILYPGIVVGALALTAGSFGDGVAGSLGRAAAGAAVHFGILLIVALVARGGFGFGDVKLGVLLGGFVAHVSWGALAVSVFGGFFVGGVVAVGLLAARRAGRKSAIPFGPSMVIAAYVAIVWGDAITDWYLG